MVECLSLILIISACNCLFLFLFSKLSRFSGRTHTGLPNGNMGLPLLGETLAFLKPHKSNSLGSFLEQHCSRYGKVFKSHLFGSPTIVSCDLELSMLILQNEEVLFQSSYPKPVHDILGKLSMMLVSGELHKKLRSVAVSFISGSNFRLHFLNYVQKFSISFIDSWKDRSQVCFFKESKKFAFDLMLKNLLNIEPEDPVAAGVLQDFLSFMKGFVSLPLYIPGSSYANAVKARARISSTLQQIITERREKTVNGASLVGDFLDEILNNAGVNDEERVSILLDLLLAGYETTSGLISLVIYFLDQAPDALQKLQEEHDALRKRKDGEALDWEDYKQMEFTAYVINETVRLGNLVKFVHRRALKDIKYKGYLIPAGWQVLPIILATHLDPSLHEKPLEFNPMRWSGGSIHVILSETNKQKTDSFWGRLRICPGAELGKLETAFFLHHFVLNYRWKVKGEDYPMSCPYLDFKRGLVLEIEPIHN